jgi:hypothetical protein
MYIYCLEEWRGGQRISPQGITSPLGDKIDLRGTTSPLGVKVFPKGEVKNGPLRPVATESHSFSVTSIIKTHILTLVFKNEIYSDNC